MQDISPNALNTLVLKAIRDKHPLLSHIPCRPAELALRSCMFDDLMDLSGFYSVRIPMELRVPQLIICKSKRHAITVRLDDTKVYVRPTSEGQTPNSFHIFKDLMNLSDLPSLIHKVHDSS